MEKHEEFIEAVEAQLRKESAQGIFVGATDTPDGLVISIVTTETEDLSLGKSVDMLISAASRMVVSSIPEEKREEAMNALISAFKEHFAYHAEQEDEKESDEEEE